MIKLHFYRGQTPGQDHVIAVSFPDIVTVQESDTRKAICEALDKLQKAIMLVSLGGHLPDMHHEEAVRIWQELSAAGLDMTDLARQTLKPGPPREDTCVEHIDCLVIGGAHCKVSRQEYEDFKKRQHP